jgi:phosphoglycerate dehydrogenase-like enzyme
MPHNFEVAFTADFLSGGKVVYKDIGLSLLKEADISYRFLDYHERTLSARSLEGLDALISLSPRITADSLSSADRLIGIARFGVGYDMVDVNACTGANVGLFITVGSVNYSVAEAILGWMLALGHRLRQKDRLTREGRWSEKSYWMGSEIRRKVVGIIGLGGIGSTLVGFLRPFGTQAVIAFDPYVDSAKAHSLGVRLVELAELVSRSDYVVICCPLTKETRDLLGSSELALMKPSAYLINAARGGIVNEEALVEALKSGGIAGAAVDVFTSEPADSHHPLCQLDNVILAPHAIAWTDELFAENGYMCCRQVISLSRGEVPEGLVNKEVLERPGFKKKLQRFEAKESSL